MPRECSMDPRPRKETAKPGTHATPPRRATPVVVVVTVVGAILGAPTATAALNFDSFAGDHNVVFLARGVVNPPPPPPPPGPIG